MPSQKESHQASMHGRPVKRLGKHTRNLPTIIAIRCKKCQLQFFRSLITMSFSGTELAEAPSDDIEALLRDCPDVGVLDPLSLELGLDGLLSDLQDVGGTILAPLLPTQCPPVQPAQQPGQLQGQVSLAHMFAATQAQQLAPPVQAPLPAQQQQWDKEQQQRWEQQGQQAKRRGRKAQHPQLLSDKQLKKREANRRSEQRQRQLMRETEERWQATSADLERERVQHESARLASSTLESMLGFKDDLLQSLMASELDLPPKISVPPPLVDVIRKQQVIEAFGADGLTRYAPMGYTDHLDATGYVAKAPPFEAVARDWREIVFALKKLLDKGRVTGDFARSEGRLGGAVQQAQQPQQQQVQHAQQGSWASSSGLLIPGGSSTGAAQRAKHAQQEGQEAQQPQRCQDDVTNAGAAYCAACCDQAEARAGPEGEPAPPASESAALADAAASDAAAAAGGGGGGDGVVEGCRLGVSPTQAAGALGMPSLEPWPGALSAQDWKALDVTYEGQTTDWETLQQGLDVDIGGEAYSFNGEEMCYMAALMRRVGVLCWSNLILWPENIHKLIAVRLDDYQDVPSIEEELPRWRHIIQGLHLRPDQLKRLVGYHREWMAGLRPALHERAATLRRLRELSTAGLSLEVAGFQQVQSANSLTLAECNAALVRSSQTLSAVSATYTSSVFKIFDGPVQDAKFVTLSWPTFPQLHVLGVAAALELGLDMDTYTSFSELWGAHHQRECQQE